MLITKETADVEKILIDFLSFLNENGYINDYDFVYETQIKKFINQIKTNKMEKTLKNNETAQLGIGAVIPSFLTHPYAQVVCTNKGELNYVLEWAKQNGKEVSEHYYKVEKFPYHLFLAGKIVGWTDSTNRVGDKFSFREFVDGVNWV